MQKNGTTMYMPVEHDAGESTMGHDKVQISLYDLPDNSLTLCDITKEHFLRALKRTKPTVCLADLDEFIDWTKEFGEFGSD